MQEDSIVNKVANSGLLTLNLEDYFDPRERVVFDIKDQLFMGLMLKEKDFREFIKTNDWSRYQDQLVAITCTADAIVPTWAYMLVANSLAPYAGYYVFGNEETLETALYLKALEKIDLELYRDQRVVVKGCGDQPIPNSAYVEITRLLSPVVKSIMYGEPCSTVPVYKKKAGN